MAYTYAHQGFQKEHTAQAVGTGLPISFKSSIMICNAVRKMPLARAKGYLKEVIALRKPVKFTRFTNGLGHRRGDMAAGRYPQKAATHILQLLEAAEANAQFKGLNTEGLMIAHIAAQNGGAAWRSGRMRRRKMKRTTVEVLLKEEEGKKAGKKESKAVKAAAPAAATAVPVKEKAATVAKEAQKAEAPKAVKPSVKQEAPKTAGKEAQKAEVPNADAAGEKSEQEKAQENVEKILDKIQRSA